MKKQVLFIQGGGDDGYKADADLVSVLQEVLGENYDVQYPKIASDDDAPDFGWPEQIGKQIANLTEEHVLVAHSLGASMLLKYLSKETTTFKAAGIFLLAAPFWTGKEEWKQGLKLPEDFAKHLPKNVRFYFYHCKDDEEVPFDQFASYRHNLPEAIFREIETGGHQFKGMINLIAIDIKNLFL